jgi:aspartokinase/homoserine dehydrogenase 1
MSTNAVLLGFGAIGRELARQLATNSRSATRVVRVCGVIDRTGFVYDSNGLSWKRLMELRARKADGASLANVEGGVAALSTVAIDSIVASSYRGTNRFALVDVTASDTSAHLERAIARGWDLVLANKIPLAGAQIDVDRLTALVTKKRATLLHEATVGAGLPVIDTLRKLLESGDRVQTIEGCPSGTLGFLFGELGRGKSFSYSLRRAVEHGYTEPDPRDDLRGTDVARKALILGRILGFRGELADIGVESLVPAHLESVSRDEFVARVGEIDDAWSTRVNLAASRGCVLRYRVRVARRSIAVGLVEVSIGSSLSALSGTDNQFSFTTTRYRENPLVVTGPGAGAAVTAAGVYNDLLMLASTARRRVVA